MGRWSENEVTVIPDDSRIDEWIVVRCQLGERQAFDELIQRWHEPIWKYVRRQVGDYDSAKEVTQDVWIRVLRGIHPPASWFKAARVVVRYRPAHADGPSAAAVCRASSR